MTQQKKKLVYRAGLIPYIVQDGKVLMLFVKPSDPKFGGSTFQIPKGHVDEGETAKQAAIREAQEEAGLDLSNVVGVEEVGVFMGRTTLFVARVKDSKRFGQPNFEVSATKWMTVEEFSTEGRELHRPVVKAAYRKILKIEQLTNE